MEAFSLLKFWRIPAGDDVSTTTITTDGRIQAAETDDYETDDEDSFFDLEFTSPGCDEKEANGSDFVESHNDDLFSKGRFNSPPLESNSKPQSPISSFLRSPPKLRVLMLFKKPKCEKTEAADVEEVPIWSLLTRVNSSRNKLQRQSAEEDSSKRFTKDMVQKYLKLIKPLYVRVSKRYGEDVKFCEKVSTADPSSSPAIVRSPSKRPEEKQGIRAAAAPLRVACKQLGKSRSESSAAAGICPAPARKSDDSLQQQHDGIQSAILHCKRSYNSSRDFSGLSRFASESSHEISVDPRNSTDEEEEKKRSSI